MMFSENASVGSAIQEEMREIFFDSAGVKIGQFIVMPSTSVQKSGVASLFRTRRIW